MDETVTLSKMLPDVNMQMQNFMSKFISMLKICDIKIFLG